jgi:hypothetical protein
VVVETLNIVCCLDWSAGVESGAEISPVLRVLASLQVHQVVEAFFD